MDDLIFDAIEFSSKAHRGQFRKGTKIPYIFHPISVAKLLLEFAYDQDIVIAGILHDTIEDTPVTAGDIQKKFNKNIARLVTGASEKNKEDTWDNRKKETLVKLASAPLDLLALSCADKLDNIRSIQRDYKKFGENLWTRFNQPREKQNWYYSQLSELYTNRMEEFDRFPLAALFIKTVHDVFPITHT